MKTYPSIPHWNKGLFGEQCWAFEKLDGSNIRAEWSKKRGFYKFGTKTQLINENDSGFGHFAIPLFMNKYSENLENAFRQHYRNIESFVVFFEFFGSDSFAGSFPLDNRDVVLFDVSAYKKGFIPPKEFISNFGHFGIPELLYKGNYNREFVNDVQQGRYTKGEGVVCKGVRKNLIWTCKVKTNTWLQRLKETKGLNEVSKELNGDFELIENVRNL